MDTYSLLREIADSWVLLAMFAFFIGAAIWAFLPSQTHARREAQMIPLRNDPDSAPTAKSAAAPCTKSCASCACAKLADELKGFDHV